MEILWEKKGLIFAPSGAGFFKTHAARPIPYKLNDETLRIFFSSRDDDDRMLPTFIDVKMCNPSHILYINEEPLVDLGARGAFDDSGVTLGSILSDGNEAYIYYTGWKRRRINVTYELSIGILFWHASKRSFSRLYAGPILAQDRHHPFLVAGPFVMRDKDIYRMWYCSGTEWRICSGNPEPIYTVFYAESLDGINWTPQIGPVIEYKFDGEVVSAPWILKNGDLYHMWYSTRGSGTKNAKNFTIGYAESTDGIKWHRRDELAGISRSESGWDSEMICYPSFFAHEDVVYMFYSGNSVGKGGFGYAVTKNFLLREK